MFLDFEKKPKGFEQLEDEWFPLHFARHSYEIQQIWFLGRSGRFRALAKALATSIAKNTSSNQAAPLTPGEIWNA